MTMSAPRSRTQSTLVVPGVVATSLRGAGQLDRVGADAAGAEAADDAGDIEVKRRQPERFRQDNDGL
jgi:hypothetical protein